MNIEDLVRGVADVDSTEKGTLQHKIKTVIDVCNAKRKPWEELKNEANEILSGDFLMRGGVYIPPPELIKTMQKLQNVQMKLGEYLANIEVVSLSSPVFTNGSVATCFSMIHRAVKEVGKKNIIGSCSDTHIERLIKAHLSGDLVTAQVAKSLSSELKGLMNRINVGITLLQTTRKEIENETKINPDT